MELHIEVPKLTNVTNSPRADMIKTKSTLKQHLGSPESGALGPLDFTRACSVQMVLAWHHCRLDIDQPQRVQIRSGFPSFLDLKLFGTDKKTTSFLFYLAPDLFDLVRR